MALATQGYDRVFDFAFLPDDVEAFVAPKNLWNAGHPFAIYEKDGAWGVRAGAVWGTGGAGRVDIAGLRQDQLGDILRQLILARPWDPDDAERNRVAFYQANPGLIGAGGPATVFQHGEYLDSPSNNIPSTTYDATTSTPAGGISPLLLLGLLAAALLGGK